MTTRRIAFALTLLASFAARGGAETVFDNTVNTTLSNGFLGGAEWADDIHLTKGGSMSGFSFGYLSNGSTQATIRFYANDALNGPKPAAGAHFFAITVAIPGGGSSGLHSVALATPVAVAQHLWMSIQFNGSSGSAPIYNPPAVGTSDPNMVVHVASATAGSIFGPSKNSFQFGIVLADPEWLDLGHSLTGTVGPPELTATGTLASGAPYSIELSDARPNAAAWMILGTSAVNAPFFGGVLVPSPNVVLPVATDGAGGVAIAGATPAGLPSGVTIIAQFWILDPLGIHGYAASNAELATTP